jgi:ABC-2 type transport system permease protein
MGITTIMLVFNEADLSKRNRCSPLSPFRMNLQIFLGNATFALVVWLVICAVNLLLYGQTAGIAGIALLCLNALVFTIVSLAIGFLAGKYIKNGIVQSAFANVVSLGISFISGVFVEQGLLSGSVLKVASFLPGYWYVKAVNTIRDLADYSFQSMTPLFCDMLIQLGFAAAFIIIALVVTKQQRVSRA